MHSTNVLAMITMMTTLMLGAMTVDAAPRAPELAIGRCALTEGLAGVEATYASRHDWVVEADRLRSQGSSDTVLTMMTGPRWHLPPSGAVRPFLQLLGGAGVTSGSGGDEVGAALLIAPGAGLDVGLSRAFALRGQFDILVPLEGGSALPRASAGFAWRLGTHAGERR